MCSNCDHLKFYMRKDGIEGSPWELTAELDPDRTEFNYLTSPPFVLDRGKVPSNERHGSGHLRIDGYLKGQSGDLAIPFRLGVESKFHAAAG